MEISDFDLIYRSVPLLLKGAILSVKLLITAATLSLFLGGTLGVATCKRLRWQGIAPFFEVVTFVLRAVPFYVQLLIAYFVIPDLFHLQMEPFTAAVFALGFCSSGYTAQVFRCGINSIPTDQWETAFTLGYSNSKALRYIIFPQMIRNILPALTNELDALLKSTSILASIGLLELTRMGMNIVSREMEPMTIYLAVAAFYIAISGVMNVFSKWLERRLSYANG